MAGFRLSPAAIEDLNGIFDYTAAQWGLPQATRYMQTLQDACAELARAPQLAQDCSPIRSGYRRGIAGRHVIYFRTEHDHIAVIRILHQRMDAPRHL